MEQNLIAMFQVYLVYTLFIILIPSVIFRIAFPEKERIKRFFMSFLSGNIIVISIVYILAFLKIYNVFTLLLLYLLSLAGICIVFRYKEVKEYCIKWRELLNQISGGTLKRKTLIQKVKDRYRGRKKKRSFSPVLFSEGVLVAGVLLFVVYILSHRVLTLESFSAPDEEVHLQWIQSLLNNNLFHSGIYPYGMHNVVSAVCLLMGRTASGVLKYFGVINGVWTFLIIYLAVRSFCKNRISVLGAFAVVGVTNLFYQESFSRFQFPVPHEFAVPFFIIMGCFLLWYLKDQKREDLIYFGIGFALTLLSHFHTAIVAGFFCICVGCVFVVYAYRRKLIRKIFLCGFLAFVLGVWPIGAGMLQGREFEQSMAWAVSVIRGWDNLSLANQRKEKELKEQNKKLGIEEEEKEEEKKKEKEIYPLFSGKTLEDLTEHSYSKEKYTVLVLIMLGAGVILYLPRLCFERWRKKKISFETWARLPLYLFSALLLVLMVSEIIGIPVLLYPTRLVSYLFFTTCFILAAPFEELYNLLDRYVWTRGLVLCATAGVVGTIAYHVQKEKLYAEFPLFYYFQTTGVNRAVTKIIKTYPERSWTLVSPVTETSMVYREGYHYEWIDFLEEVENGEDIRIPTRYVFFSVEKMPIVRFGVSFRDGDPLLKERPTINIQDAQEDLAKEENREDYYKYQREAVMAKALAWVQRFRQQYPQELTVYYEDDEVRIYRLEQNEAYNNLSVSYK